MKTNEAYETYAVTLEIRTGDYEKNSQILIHAPNEEKAWHFACYAESHNPYELQWNNNRGCNEPDWSFDYRVHGVDRVPKHEVPVLRKHMSRMLYDAEILAKCGNYLEEMF